jgi:hypothetical protein
MERVFRINPGTTPPDVDKIDQRLDDLEHTPVMDTL